MSFCIKAEIREQLSKGSTNKLRHSGSIPAVMYFSGEGKGSINLSVPFKEFTSFLSSVKEGGLGVEELILDLNGVSYRVLVKGIQYGVVSYPVDIMHLDFMVIKDDSKVIVKVPVVLKNHLSGECKGLQAGGVVRKNIRQVALRGTWSSMPKFIFADMKDCNVGDSVYAGKALEGLDAVLHSIPDHEVLATVDKKRGK